MLTERFTYEDPTVIVEDDVSPEAFRAAMNAIHVGGTFKITGARRHQHADDFLLRHLDLSGAHILDIGVSDGSTCVDLIHRLPPDFGSFTMADRYFELTWTSRGRRRFLFDDSGACVMVAGPRLVAWPAMSGSVAFLYRPLVRRARRERGQPVVLLNPEARALLSDPRISYCQHDVFEPWRGTPPSLIKTANLLRRLYFDDARILEGLRAIHASLPDGGHFLLVDHPRGTGQPPAAGLYRRAGDGFEPVAFEPRAPEVHNLVLQVGCGEDGRPRPARA